MGYEDRVKFEDMVGKTFTDVRKIESGLADSDAILFTVSDSEQYAMLYYEDCCASCSIEDICGDLRDLVGSPIVRAEENGSEEPENLPSIEEHPESFTWTFYRIGTAKGTVVIRWYGSSNGYYSESAEFEKVRYSLAER
jgi:hypothetical protein